jgi:hypothetical protein
VSGPCLELSVEANLRGVQVKCRSRHGRSQKREDYEDWLEEQSEKEDEA